MGRRVIHFEVIGRDAPALQKFYGELFDWSIDASNPMSYGIIQPQGEGSIGGGIGPSPDGSSGMVTFYVESDDVSGDLQRVEAAGGSVVMPETKVMEDVVLGLFADPEGHVVGLVKAQS